jgi:uncharacterized protein (TIGR03083 family)
MTSTNWFAEIKAREAAEFQQLSAYAGTLDASGWVEQSYCTDWLVYQVVSHIGSGSRIGGMRLNAWAHGGPPAGREQMQQVWGFFDSLRPDQMLDAYLQAADEYQQIEGKTPDSAGDQEIEGFAGKRPLYAYQAGRLWELALHAWDVYVARKRDARLDAATVAVLAGLLQYMSLPIDAQRARGLEGLRVQFDLTDTGGTYWLDTSLERPRLAQGAGADAALAIEGPAEEVIRFVAGRQVVPGAEPTLRATRGTPQDLANLRRALR